jgi:low temperature requirement protein LtrA
VTERDWTTALVLNALLTVATAGALWWGYFGRAKDWLEHELHHRRDADQSRLARDAFSLLHFPMIVGIIAYAAAIEVILSHPDEPLSFEARALLSLGILLFSGFTALAVRRCGYRLLWPRLVCTGAAALAVAVLPDVPPALALAIMLLGMAATAVIEQRADPVPSPHGADR